jgi:hypothetical protein
MPLPLTGLALIPAHELPNFLVPVLNEINESSVLLGCSLPVTGLTDISRRTREATPGTDNSPSFLQF